MSEQHKPGCDALGGYGHGVAPCSCGATPPAPEGWEEAVEIAKLDVAVFDDTENQKLARAILEMDALRKGKNNG